MVDGQHMGRKIRRKDNQGFYVLGKKLGKGGEGEVYAITNAPEWVVKVYHEWKRPDPVHSKKLFVMEELGPPLTGNRTGHPLLAWPDQIIRDRESGSVIGFVMPRVDGMTVEEFFIPSVRRQKLQAMGLQFNGNQLWQTKLNIIKNLSKIVDEVHEQGHLVGDINERNIRVEPTRGDVCIMDCDSFQVRDVKTRTIYRCKVGSPNYTAPELLRQMGSPCDKKQCPGGTTKHDVGFACVRRNQEHDRFGLAVIAFQLLMDEHHPFNCQIIGSDAGVSEVKDKIERGYYPYSSSKPSHIRIGNPEVERRFKKLPKNMKDLFEQAFVRV